MVNAEAQDVLSYFNTKLSTILPYAVQVCHFFLHLYSKFGYLLAISLS